MLPNNFDSLANDRPELRPAILRVADWARTHPDWNVLDPRILAKDLPDLDPLLLSLALRELVRNGFYRRVFMVVAPSGALTEGEYDDPRSVPERVRDNWDNYFDRDNADIIPVLKPAA